jgi:hypothetical protein
MTKHYQPPTVEDDTSECYTDNLAPQPDGNQITIIPCDQSQTTTSSTTGSAVSDKSSSDSRSETNSQPTVPNPIDVECWERILQLYEDYQHSHSPTLRRHLTSPTRSAHPKRRNNETRPRQAPHNPFPTVPPRLTQALKRCREERGPGEENAPLASVKRALLDDPVGLALSCKERVLDETGLR